MNSKDLEKKAQAALVFLHEKAEEHAVARAQADYLESWQKVELSRLKELMQYADSDAAKTAAAMRHPDYKTALEAKKEADTNWYAVQFKREAANAVIGAWQTLCANERRLP